MRHDVATLGQVFTPAEIVSRMLTLRRNRGRVLDPACGDGAFSALLPGCVAVEIDAAGWRVVLVSLGYPGLYLGLSAVVTLRTPRSR